MSSSMTAAPIQAPAMQQPNPAEHILQLSTSYIASMCLNVAAKLGIADLLAKGPRHVSELAAASQTQEDRLYRMLRVLSSVGVFNEIAPRTFALTPAAETLRSDAQDSTLPMALWMADPFHYRIYAEMMYSVTTGEIAFDHLYGKPIFKYMPEDPAEAEVFNNAMTCLSNMMVPEVLEAYDFSGIERLMDVGCGHGALLRAILKRYPMMHGVLYDLEPVIEGARNAAATNGLAERCEHLSGDFFQSVPDGADAIMMKHIIHDWDDDKATLILRNCRQALQGKSNAKILLVESVLTPGNEPHFGKFIDLEMFMMVGGRERTEEEFRKLFSAAGFRLTRVIPTNAPLWLVEGVPA